MNLTKGAAGYYELNFTVTTKGAVACSYVCMKEGETLPAADEILASGTAVATLNAASAEKITGLESNTEYRIVAAVKGGDGSTKLSEPLEMSTTDSGMGSLEDMKLNYLSFAEYSFDSNTQVANYVVTIGNARPDSNGEPAQNGRRDDRARPLRRDGSRPVGYPSSGWRVHRERRRGCAGYLDQYLFGFLHARRTTRSPLSPCWTAW